MMAGGSHLRVRPFQRVGQGVSHGARLTCEGNRQSAICHGGYGGLQFDIVGARWPRKNSGSHIDASLSRQPLVKGERLVRYEVNAVMHCRLICKRSRRNHPGERPCAQCGKCSNNGPSVATYALSIAPEVPKLLPQRVRCNQQCAMPMQRARVLEQARRSASPQKN